MRVLKLKKSRCVPVLLALATSVAQATACTNANLFGAFGLQEQGMHDEAAGFVAFRSIGSFRFDGRGNGTKNETLWFSDRSINPSASTMTYAVRPDCSFTFTYLESGETFEGVLVANGLKLLYMETSGDIVRNGQAERIKGGR